MPSKNNLHGFTVVELIVVVVIISILATIGIMSWSGAQNSAKQNAAESTLAKMKLSLSDYFTDTNIYPINKTAICDTPTHTVIPAGELYTEFCTGPNNTRYTYAPSPLNCNNAASKCTSYVLTAQKEIWSGATDETLTP